MKGSLTPSDGNEIELPYPEDIITLFTTIINFLTDRTNMPLSSRMESEPPRVAFFFFLAFCTILFSPFNHNNMISKFYLNRRVCKHRFSQPTHKQGKRFFLKWSRHGISGHPTQVSPWLALSSQHCAATSLNLIPDFNFSMASIIFPCFSHWMCLTFTPLPPCGTVSLLVRTVTPGGCSPSLPFRGIAFSLGQHLWNLQLNSQLQCGIFFFNVWYKGTDIFRFFQSIWKTFTVNENSVCLSLFCTWN